MFRAFRFYLPAFFLITLVSLAACSSRGDTIPGIQSPTLNRQTPTTQSSVLIPFNSLRVGWAYEAYPEASTEKLRGDFALMRTNGANAVWLGHNNPGQVDARKVEPGMSYAVYAALQNENDPLHDDAQQMFDAVKRALDAARANDLGVILPIGYQIQMGDAWNQRHPDNLRLTSDGQPLNLFNSGYTASPYSEQYRADITRYYEWAQRELVAPYQDIIVMLSLADEPMGGDYSAHAQQEFERRYGKSWDELSQNEMSHRNTMQQLGEFQSGVIADYAAWSANEWARLNPQVLTTMSFHGGDTARRVWGLPDVEKLFSQTPDNFVVTFDAYLHDDLASKPATSDEAAQLKLFLTTLGNFSRVYNKRIALWGGVNAWGLAQESSAPLEVSDAVTNLLLLHDLPARAGGNVWGVFAWNYNVKQQGLENYARPTTFDLKAMQVAVERAFPLLRTRQALAQTPDIAIVTAPRAMYRALSESRASDHPPAWFDTTPYARAFADRDAVINSSPQALSTVRDATYFIVTAPAADLDEQTLNFLRERFAAGQIIFGDESIARAFGAHSKTWHLQSGQLPEEGGVVHQLQQ